MATCGELVQSSLMVENNFQNEKFKEKLMKDKSLNLSRGYSDDSISTTQYYSDEDKLQRYSSEDSLIQSSENDFSNINQLSDDNMSNSDQITQMKISFRKNSIDFMTNDSEKCYTANSGSLCGTQQGISMKIFTHDYSSAKHDTKDFSSLYRKSNAHNNPSVCTMESHVSLPINSLDSNYNGFPWLEPKLQLDGPKVFSAVMRYNETEDESDKKPIHETVISYNNQWRIIPDSTIENIIFKNPNQNKPINEPNSRILANFNNEKLDFNNNQVPYCLPITFSVDESLPTYVHEPVLKVPAPKINETSKFLSYFINFFHC